MYARLEQDIGAGNQFDGTAGKGRFEWGLDRSGVSITRIDLVMGVEAKDWEIRVVNIIDNSIVSLLEKGTGAVQNVTLVGTIPIASIRERLEIITASATSAMKAIVVWKDEPERER